MDGVINGFYAASNGCISVVKNQGSPNISTHTVSFSSLHALHFLFGSNGLAWVNRVLNHTSELDIWLTLLMGVKWTDIFFWESYYLLK